MLWIDLVVFILFFILLISKIEKSYLGKILYIFIFIFSLIEIGCILTKNTHLDLAIISNVDKKSLKIAIEQFKLMLSIFILVLIAGTILIVKYYEKIKNYILKLKINNSIFLIILLVLNLFPNSILRNSYITAKMISNSKVKKNYNEILNNMGVNKNWIVNPEEIQASSGKNVVLIYLESFERGFFNKNYFSNLTPNLDKLKKEWTYYDNYQEVPGTGWTMGAMYSTQTGMPTLFGLHGNEIFNNIDKIKVPSIGKIMEKAGYEQIFIKGADLDFSGTRNFFELTGYKGFGNSELDNSYSRNSWGVRDKEVFEEAKIKYLELQKTGKPFNLTVLNLDTHFPHGLPDERFRQILGNELSGVEYAIKTIDYLIGDFIKFLKDQPSYKDTVIYIIPDHTIMGSEEMTPVVKKLKNTERKLWMLTNSSNKLLNSKSEEITFYDIPTLILKGAEIKTNVKFIGEYIKDKSKTDIDLLQNLQLLNLSLIEFSEIKNKLEIVQSEGNNSEFIVYSDGREIDRFFLNKDLKRYYSIDENYKIKGKFSTDKNISRYSEDYSNSILKLEVFLDNKNNIQLSLVDRNDITLSFKKENYYKKIINLGKYSIGKIDSLELTRKELKKNIDLAKEIAELRLINNLNEYFYKLKKLNKKNIVGIISVQDEGSNQYSNYKEGFDIFKLSNLEGKSRQSYLSVFRSNGELVYEKLEDKLLTQKIKLEDINLELVSSGYHNGNTSKIIVNREDYSKNKRGLNIVILDLDNNLIIDIFNVDTCGDPNLIINR